MKLRALALAAALLVAPLAGPLAGQDYAHVALPDAKQEAQAVALMDSLRCIVCQGQPISGSNAGLAEDMRRMVRERIATGESPEEVRAWLVSRYGDWVSFKPQVRPATLPLWIVPLLAIVLGGWLVSRRLKRSAR